MKSEKRQYFRLSNKTPVEVLFEDQSSITTHVTEISLGGIRFQCPQSPSLDSQVSLAIKEDLKIQGQVVYVHPRYQQNEVGVQFTKSELEESQLDRFLLELRKSDFHKVGVEGFKLLVHCVALDGIRTKEKELLREWLQHSQFPLEFSEIISELIETPPSANVVFKRIQQFLLAHKEDTVIIKALFHNLGLLMSLENTISLHEKLIVRTIMETVRGLTVYLDEFNNPFLIQAAQHYQNTKEYILRRLKAIWIQYPEAERSWEPTENELWILFLTTKIGILFTSAQFIDAHLELFDYLIQSILPISDHIRQTLIQESTKIKEIEESELVEEFLLVADPDQRSFLIETMRELMQSQANLSEEAIETFMALVKGRGRITSFSAKSEQKAPKVLRIGCSPDNDLVLPAHLHVGQCVQIEIKNNQFRIVSIDQLSFSLRGRAYRKYKGTESFVEFRIEQVVLYFFPQAGILFYETSPSYYLSLNNYDVLVPNHLSLNPFNDKKQLVLHRLQAVFRTGEFVGIFGPTGSGKSTLLLSLLNRFQTIGEVGIEGMDYQDYYRKHFQEIGYVPQDDVLYRDLTVKETLYYSISLRGLGSNKQQIQELIHRTVADLGLEKASEILIGDDQKKGISGGQRKRVNLALELLSENTLILMLDEPTSGLDPGTELLTHQLLKTLSRRGLMILMVSHSLYDATINLLDMALILTDRGEIAYFGPAIDAKEYFQVDTPAEIFNVLSKKSSNEWAEQFKQIENRYYRKYVQFRLDLTHIRNILESQSNDTLTPKSKRKKLLTSRVGTNVFTQFWVCTQRLFQRQIRDGQSLLSRTVQSVLLALIMRIAYVAPESGLLMLLSIVPVWLGATMSVRSINSESSMFLREYRYGTAITPYVLSVFFVNALFVLAQTFIFLCCLYALIPFDLFGFRFTELLLIIYLTSLTGVSLGMMLSTLFTSQQASVNALPVFLVLMILFGGSVIPLKEMGTLSYATAHLTPTRWALESLVYKGNCLVTKVPNGTPWEICGNIDETLGKRLSQGGLFPLDIEAPVWEKPWYETLFTSNTTHPKIGVGLRVMGFYRQLECSFEDYDTCPPALIHPQRIKLLLAGFVIIILITCGFMLYGRYKDQR
ncbi:ABC transporter permease [Deltaproteobacteria bacterium TL4]